MVEPMDNSLISLTTQPLSEMATNRETVVATGCPYSGWETILPSLQGAGFELLGDPAHRWPDELFTNVSMDSLLSLDTEFTGDNNDHEKIGLVADSRSLWLLDLWVARFPRSRFLLFYNSAETSLAHALYHGLDPQQFLETWAITNRQLLQFLRRHRRSSLLLNAETAGDNPHELIMACRDMGLELNPQSIVTTSTAGLPDLEYYIAEMMVASLPDIQSLQAELDSCACVLGDIEARSPVQPMAIIERYHARKKSFLALEKCFEEKQQSLADARDEVSALSRQRDAMQQHLSRLDQEMILQMQQLEEWQDLLEQSLDQNSELQQQHDVAQQNNRMQQQHQDVLTAEQTALRQVQEENAAALKTAEKEKELLMLQLHQVQQELDAAFLREQGASQKFSEREQQLTEAQNTIEQLRLEQESNAAARKMAEDEQELLLLQLHQVQEELEHYFLRYRELNEIESKREEKYRHRPVEIPKKIPEKRLQMLFDAAWYEKQAGKKRSPLRHYLKEGWKQDYSPHPLFDPQFYKEANGLEDLSVCPLLHFVSGGFRNGMSPHPMFDVKWYLHQNPDVREQGVNPVVHYLKFGEKEGRKPVAGFDPLEYVQRRSDVQETGVSPLLHYIKFGKTE